MSEEQSKQKDTTFLTRERIIIGILVITVIGFIAVNNIKVPYTVQVEKTVQVPYTVQEPYTVEVPYTDTEYYSEKEPYTSQDCDTQPYSYAVENQEGHHWSLFDTTCWSQADIVNHEDQTGTFTAQATFERAGSDYIWGPKSITVYAKSRKTVKAVYDCSAGEDVIIYYLSVKPPTKQVCKDTTQYKDVRKSRSVTKYRTETRYEDVTKYSTETQTESETRYHTLWKEWWRKYYE